MPPEQVSKLPNACPKSAAQHAQPLQTEAPGVPRIQLSIPHPKGSLQAAWQGANKALLEKGVLNKNVLRQKAWD